jgi:beta-glucanase (GH16 family)
MKTPITMSSLLFCLVLSACGGGSGTTESPAAQAAAVSMPSVSAGVGSFNAAGSSSLAGSASSASSTSTESPAPASAVLNVELTTPALLAALPANAGGSGLSAVAAIPPVSTTVAPQPAAIAPIAEDPVAAPPVAATPAAPVIPVIPMTPQPAAVEPIVVAAGPATSGNAASVQGPAGQDASQYVLTFEDGFDSGSSFDTSKWATDIYYKANNPTRNYNVSGGTLNIWPAQDNSGSFFDRTIVSENRFAQQYGYFEVEARLPVGAGLHPVISLTANNGPEIAIMHAYSGAPNGAWSNAGLRPIDYVVTAVSKPDSYIGEFRARTALSVPDLSAGFHKYGVRWDATTVRYYFDGVQIGQAINHNTIRTPMYFFIGLWMVNEETSPTTGGGTLSQSNPYTPQGTGNAMKINYVRAWKFKGS